MKLKGFFSDKTFLALTWPHLVSSASQGIITLILLFILWVLSDTIFSFFAAFQSEIERISKWSVFFIVLFNIGQLFINLVVMQYYQFAPSIGSYDSKSTLKEISKATNKGEVYFQQYVVPSLILILVAANLLNMYVVNGARGESLRPAITFILPFTIALTFAHFSRIIVEAGILFLRYIIQLTRS